MSDFAMLIGGRLVAGDRSSPVVNPATGKAFAVAPRASTAQLDGAVEAAHEAFPAWAAVPWHERSERLISLADDLATDAAALARLLTEEQGKPIAEAQFELAMTEQFIRYFAGLEDPSRQLDQSSRHVEQIRRPLGVVAAIIPWNFPLLLVASKLPPALLAGNTIVIKPAPTTPLATLRFGELCARHFPAGVVNIIVDDNDLGPVLAAHPLVAKVSFTGSTETGKRVMASAANDLKRLTLELGGNDPAIVLDDADPVTVAKGLFASAFLNAGQVCCAVKRAYVHESIYDAVCTDLAALADAAIVDDGAVQGTQIGPLQNRRQFDKVMALIDAASMEGRVLAGGRAVDRPGFFIRPTIIADVVDGSPIVDEEQFGPVLPIIRYSDLDEVIMRANASPYGLGASIWSADSERARQVARKIAAGTVWINKHIDLDPAIPFAGAGHSGIGVEFGEEGLLEYTQSQIINS